MYKPSLCLLRSWGRWNRRSSLRESISMANWKIAKVQRGGVGVISEWTCLTGGRWSILLRNMRRLGCSLAGEWAAVVSLSSCL